MNGQTVVAIGGSSGIGLATARLAREKGAQVILTARDADRLRPAPLAQLDFDKARRDLEAYLLLSIQVARHAVSKVRPGGTLLFMGGTGGRRAAPGLALISALTAAGPALTRNLALELAPIRVNLIAVDGGQQLVE